MITKNPSIDATMYIHTLPLSKAGTKGLPADNNAKLDHRNNSIIIIVVVKHKQQLPYAMP